MNAIKSTLTILTIILLTSCSVVQWIPSSACEHVLYERTGADVTVKAECKV